MVRRILYILGSIVLIFVLILSIYKHTRDSAIKKTPISTGNNMVLMVIHLDRATQRKENVQKIFDTVDQVNILKNVQKHKLQAIDGLKLSSDEVKKYFHADLIEPPYYIDTSKNEVACFLSHRKAWQNIVDNNYDIGIIFEDDVFIEPEIFQKALMLGLENLRDNLLIRFIEHKPRVAYSLLNLYSDQIYFPLFVSGGMQGYIISKKTAEKLLKLTEKFDRPVDSFLRIVNYTGIYSAEIYPSGIKHIYKEIGGSTIGYERKNIWAIIKLEFKKMIINLRMIQ